MGTVPAQLVTHPAPVEVRGRAPGGARGPGAVEDDIADARVEGPLGELVETDVRGEHHIVGRRSDGLPEQGDRAGPLARALGPGQDDDAGTGELAGRVVEAVGADVRAQQRVDLVAFEEPGGAGPPGPLGRGGDAEMGAAVVLGAVEVVVDEVVAVGGAGSGGRGRIRGGVRSGVRDGVRCGTRSGALTGVRSRTRSRIHSGGGRRGGYGRGGGRGCGRGGGRLGDGARITGPARPNGRFPALARHTASLRTASVTLRRTIRGPHVCTPITPCTALTWKCRRRRSR